MYTIHLPVVQGGLLSAIKQQVIVEINSYRQYHRVDALSPHGGLMVSAQNYAEDMLVRDYNGHIPEWLKRIIPYYPEWKALAECVAAGYPDAPSVVTAFYRSPSHRDAMISPIYQDVGVGYARGEERHSFWWCVHFGSTQ